MYKISLKYKGFANGGNIYVLTTERGGYLVGVCAIRENSIKLVNMSPAGL